MKFLLELLLLGGLGHVYALISHIVKGRCLALYLRGVDRFRGFFIRGLVAFLCLMLATAGFLIVHVALFFYLSWEVESKALLFLLLGLFYFLVPLAIVCWLYSKQQWMKVSGAQEMIDHLSEPKKTK